MKLRLKDAITIAKRKTAEQNTKRYLRRYYQEKVKKCLQTIV